MERMNVGGQSAISAPSFYEGEFNTKSVDLTCKKEGDAECFRPNSFLWTLPFHLDQKMWPDPGISVEVIPLGFEDTSFPSWQSIFYDAVSI